MADNGRSRQIADCLVVVVVVKANYSYSKPLNDT